MFFQTLRPSAPRGALGPYLATNRNTANLVVHATGGRPWLLKFSIGFELPREKDLGVPPTNGRCCKYCCQPANL
jgi:hypothetical protein